MGLLKVVSGAGGKGCFRMPPVKAVTHTFPSPYPTPRLPLAVRGKPASWLRKDSFLADYHWERLLPYRQPLGKTPSFQTIIRKDSFLIDCPQERLLPYRLPPGKTTSLQTATRKDSFLADYHQERLSYKYGHYYSINTKSPSAHLSQYLP